jgi:phage FluMu protein Com
MSDMSAELDAEIRCQCGHLVARWFPDSIELKCKRCRRLVRIQLADIQGTPPKMMQL